MGDIQDRTLWMIEHNLVPTGVHLECAREVFKKAKAFDTLKALLTTSYNNGIISIWHTPRLDKFCLVVGDENAIVEIQITEKEFNILKEAITDNEPNL